MRRSRRIRGIEKKKAEAEVLLGKDYYKNYLGTRSEFKNRPDYVKHAKKVNPELLKLHNQGVNPYCALYSVVTALEVARRKPWTDEERKARHQFCLDKGRSQGDHLENTLGYYKRLFKDMDYGKDFKGDKSYGNANDLIRALQKGVCVVSLSCADVYNKFKIRSTKCDGSGDWHCIACVGFVEINNEPMFVFKDTNNHRGDPTNLAFLKAGEVCDAEVQMQEYGDPLMALGKMKRDMVKNAWTLFQEIYSITPVVSKLKL